MISRTWSRVAYCLVSVFFAIWACAQEITISYNIASVDAVYARYYFLFLCFVVIFVAFLVMQFWSSWTLERILMNNTEHFAKAERVFTLLGGFCRAAVLLIIVTSFGYYGVHLIENDSIREFNVILVTTLSSMAILRLLVMTVISPYVPHARLFEINENYVRSLWRFFGIALWIGGSGIIVTSAADIVFTVSDATLQFLEHCFYTLMISYVLWSVFRARAAIESILNKTYKNDGIWKNIFCSLNKRWWLFFGCGGLLSLGAEFCVLEGSFIPYSACVGPVAYSLIALAATQLLIACILCLSSKIRHVLGTEDKQSDTFFQRAQRNIVRTESLVIAALYTALVLIICHFCGLSVSQVAGTSWGHVILISLLGNIFFVCFGIVLYQALTIFIDYKIALVQTQNPKKERRLRTFLPLLRSVIHVAILFLGIAGVIENLGFSITPLVAGFGVLSLAISFGAQEVTKSFIQGTIVLIEDDMDTGDYVTINGTSGFVERMSVRAVYVREITGTLHIIPYSVVNAFCNLSRDYTFQMYELTIDPRERVARVIQALEEVGQEMLAEEVYRKQIIEPVQVLGVTPFDGKGVTVLWTLKTQPDPLRLVGFEFYKRLKQKFDVMNINVPVELHKIYSAEDRLSAS
ncbi:MAG: mechanosensitive ion channel [Holosporales bacterium]|jgi:small-conductance mechanosensitive channel|nr:mechanosensitive ion channel [Holosporales bacterium]